MSDKKNEQPDLDTENTRDEDKNKWDTVIDYSLIIVVIIIIVLVVMNFTGPTIANVFNNINGGCGGTLCATN